MGTRADFYVGRGQKAEWLGSIAWDGSPEGIPADVKAAKDEKSFRSAVSSFLASRGPKPDALDPADAVGYNPLHCDATFPKDGWPWPWDNSATTDYAYAFDGGEVYGSCFGRAWFDATEPEPTFDDHGPKVEFPDMSQRKRVAYGPRSGVIMIVRRKE